MAYYASRIVRTATPTLDDFKSNAAPGKPRPKSLPMATPDPWNGVSVLRTYQEAVRWMGVFPRLGSRVAELWIPDDAPVVRDAPDSRGRFNLWGNPGLLLSCVQNVLYVLARGP